MSERVSQRQRVQLQSVAEAEVMRYVGDHAAWHKHVHNVDLDAVQVLKMVEMDQHPQTIDFSSRRTGKTACKELYDLEQLATKPDQELGIVAPRQAQAQVNITYHTEAIRRSAILYNWLDYKEGRRQLSDTKYQFCHRSRAEAFGVMSNADGGDMTMISLEEVDDMPKDRLYSRFLLMLGSTRRLGASTSSENRPQVRITGVFKGADTLTELLDSGNYHVPAAFYDARARAEIRKFIDAGWLAPESVELDSYQYPLPVLNALYGMELGLLQKEFLLSLRGELSADEFVRQLLCINTASRNLVWERYLRQAMQVGLKADIQIAEPVPTGAYKKRGLIGFGYDHSGHGEHATASKYALVVIEQIGNFSCPIFVRTWAAGTDESVVRADLLSYWRYFDPDTAMGDAYGIGLLTTLCQDLFQTGLTQTDIRAIGDGESTASTWPEWPFVPLRFEGMVKHQMAQAVRACFHNGRAAVPYIDDRLTDPLVQDFLLLYRQLPNIRPAESKAVYATYEMANRKLGDDLFDAFMAALWGLVNRGVAAAPSIILTGTASRASLLQRPSRLLPV